MATELRPMSVSELLDRAFFLYRRHFLLFIGIAALPNLILLMLRLALLEWEPSITFFWRFLAGLALIPVYLVISSIAQGASIVAISDVHMGRSASIESAYAHVMKCVIDIFIASILVGIGIVFGCILFIVPGILLYLAWSLSAPVIVIEKLGPLDALPRSSKLTKGSRGRIFVVLLLALVFAWIVASIFQLPILYLAGVSRLLNPRAIPTWINALMQIANFLSTTLATPISAIAISLIYYDQRVRKEGLDLQLLISTLKSDVQNSSDVSAVS